MTTADSPTQPGAIPGHDDPRVRQAVAVELQVQALRELDAQVAAAVAVTRPFARLAEAGAALLEQMSACVGGVGGVLRGVWGGPIVGLLVALVAALALDTWGWGPEQVGAWTGDTIRAVRCDAGEPAPLGPPLPQDTDHRGPVEAPAPAPE